MFTQILGLSLTSNMLYIDPAATSVLLSSLAAVAVAVAASAIIIWRKVKNNAKKLMKNSDPNKNKEVEKDIVVNDEELVKESKLENAEAEDKKLEEQTPASTPKDDDKPQEDKKDK